MYLYIEFLSWISRKVRRGGKNIAGEEVGNISHGLPCLVQNTMAYHLLAQMLETKNRKRNGNL